MWSNQIWSSYKLIYLFSTFNPTFQVTTGSIYNYVQLTERQQQQEKKEQPIIERSV